jgi:hypothetical protein
MPYQCPACTFISDVDNPPACPMCAAPAKKPAAAAAAAAAPAAPAVKPKTPPASLPEWTCPSCEHRSTSAKCRECWAPHPHWRPPAVAVLQADGKMAAAPSRLIKAGAALAYPFRADRDADFSVGNPDKTLRHEAKQLYQGADVHVYLGAADKAKPAAPAAAAEAKTSAAASSGVRRLRVVCVSDTHVRHHMYTRQLPAGDVLVHAGDFSNDLNQRNVAYSLDDFNYWWSQQPHPVKIYVPGNHEMILPNIAVPSHDHTCHSTLTSATLFSRPVFVLGVLGALCRRRR